MANHSQNLTVGEVRLLFTELDVTTRSELIFRLLEDLVEVNF